VPAAPKCLEARWSPPVRYLRPSWAATAATCACARLSSLRLGAPARARPWTAGAAGRASPPALRQSSRAVQSPGTSRSWPRPRPHSRSTAPIAGVHEAPNARDGLVLEVEPGLLTIHVHRLVRHAALAAGHPDAVVAHEAGLRAHVAGCLLRGVAVDEGVDSCCVAVLGECGRGIDARSNEYDWEELQRDAAPRAAQGVRVCDSALRPRRGTIVTGRGYANDAGGVDEPRLLSRTPPARR